MKKRILMFLLSMVLVVPMVCGLIACGEKDNGTTYNITVWVGEGTDSLTKRQIQKFNEENEWGVTFKATVEIVSEGRAMGNAISTPQSCADIFCFAQDQLARGVYSSRLQTLNQASITAITENCDAASVAAATVGSSIRAFPMTADNGYFMYYDKRVIPEEDIDDLGKLIEDCEKAGKNFSMNLTEEGGAWYAASFFYATGCKSEWVINEKGVFTDYDDTFDSDEGVIALQGMQKLLKSSAYHASAEVSDFSASIPSAVVVSGIWGYKAAKEKLGENLGIAPLPKFTVDGETYYQLKTYLGNKLMGIKPQSDAYRGLYLQKLAMYLTSTECQLERFEEVGWGPSDKLAQQNENVLAAPALSVLARAETMPQGQYPTGWWAKLQLVTGNVKGSAAGDIASIRVALNTYSSSPTDGLATLLGVSAE